MPQVFIVAAAGAALLAGYKLVKREMKRVERAMREVAPRETAAPTDGGRLERGEDGIYRPVR